MARMDRQRLLCEGARRPAAGASQLRRGVVFYLVYAAGVQIFCVHPALEAGSWPRAWLAGALFGFFAYATYDPTNLATLKSWPLLVSVVDLLWGALVTSAAAAAGYAAAARIGA